MEASGWQNKLSSIRERNLYAFNKSLFCDVEFSVLDANGGRVTLQAHRYVLAISSPVFEAMLYGELAETGLTIELPDCTKEGLQEMLHYVYSDEVSLTGSNVMQVLYLAKKYMLPFLEQKCREYLEEQLKPEEVFIVLPQAKQLGDEKLEQHCWTMVEKETEQAVSSELFLDVSHEVLCQVLAKDKLAIKELDLFQAVDKWALKRMEEKGIEKNKINKRSILGEEAIRLIRFPLMSLGEFAGNVLPSKILIDDEITELVQMFSSLAPSTKMFSNKKRRKDDIVPDCRFSNLDVRKWNFTSGYIDAIDFTVNKPISLVGVRIFGSQGNSYDVDLKICQKNTILSSRFASFPTEENMFEGQFYGFTVTLDMPVPLDPGVRYTIAAKIQGPPSDRGKNGKTSVLCGDLVINYLESANSPNGTGVSGGQFPTILLV